MQVPFNKTKIVATLGPASQSKEVLKSLIKRGVDVFRLNFSHGSLDDKQKIIDDINDLNEKATMPVSILVDLQGPKIRIGEVPEQKPFLVEGDEVTLTSEEQVSDKKTIYISYKNLAKELEKNHRVFIDDGKIELQVLRSDLKNKVVAKVIYGGYLNSRKGVNLPDTNLSVPCLTPKDLKDLDFILKQNVHWVALSFVRSAKDIVILKEKLKAKNHKAKVVAKIEKPEAITHIAEIIDATDAIMVARGDLGVEIAGERVPLIQKDVIRRSLVAAKPVIVATQMMESMIENPKPTRAEINDIANAVLDGADAVMLSGETAVGKYPKECIEIITKILQNTEKSADIYYKDFKPIKSESDFLSNSICYNATTLCKQVSAKAIIGMTVSGYTAFKTSSYRPKSFIYIFTENKEILSTLNLVWGVRAFYYSNFNSTDDTVKEVKEILQEKGLLRKGDVVINLGSMPLIKKGKTNMLRVSRIS